MPLKSTESAIQIAPKTIGAPKTLSRLKGLLEEQSHLSPSTRQDSKFPAWREEVISALAHFYGLPSLQLDQFKGIRFFPSTVYRNRTMPDSVFTLAKQKGLEQADAFIVSRIKQIEEDVAELAEAPVEAKLQRVICTKKVFLVHGHDHGAKETVARFISRLDLEPVILHEQPDQGRTIIEKFEHYADVSCAVVLLTPDDIGGDKNQSSAQERRARQNVIFELGFFIGRLGRKRTFALLQAGVTKPSDVDGVLYIPMDDPSWQLILVRELNASGLNVDANKVFS